MTYLDRTFCEHSDTCGTKICFRNFNEWHKANCKEWAKAGGHIEYIAFTDFKGDGCGFMEVGDEHV